MDSSRLQLSREEDDEGFFSNDACQGGSKTTADPTSLDSEQNVYVSSSIPVDSEGLVVFFRTPARAGRAPFPVMRRSARKVFDAGRRSSKDGVANPKRSGAGSSCKQKKSSTP